MGCAPTPGLLEIKRDHGRKTPDTKPPRCAGCRRWQGLRETWSPGFCPHPDVVTTATTGRQPSPPPRVLLPLFPRLEYAALCPSFVCSSPHSVSCPLPRLLLHPPPPLLAAAFRRELSPPALFHCQPQDSFIGPPCLFFAHHPPHLLHLGSPIRFPAFFYFLFFQIKGVIITVVT